MKAIASGNYDKVGTFSPLKSPAESGGVTVGKGLDFIKNKVTGKNDNYFGEVGKNFGGIAFEVADFILGVNGVRKGVKKIADTSYRFKEISSIGNKIIPSFNVAVNKVSQGEKFTVAGDITNTVANWMKKVDDYFNKNNNKKK